LTLQIKLIKKQSTLVIINIRLPSCHGTSQLLCNSQVILLLFIDYKSCG